MMRLILVSALLCLAQTAFSQADTSQVSEADTPRVQQTDTPRVPMADILPSDTTEVPSTDSLQADTSATSQVAPPRTTSAPSARSGAVRWRRPPPEPLYINPDTILRGPAPTDTTKDAINGFLRDFYRDYNSDRRLLEIPFAPPETHVVPDLDFQLRDVRPAWQLLILALITILAAALSRFFRKDLRDMFEGFVSNRLINQTIREPGMLNTPMALMLLILGSLSLGALLYFTIPRELLPLPYNGPELYLFFSGLVLLVYLARIFLLKLTAFIFGLREFVNSYLYILYTATGTICFPILVLLFARLLGPAPMAALSIPMLQIIFLLFFVYQYTRGIWYLANTFQFPKIYLILYLCAFEICPILILGMGLFNS